MPYPPDRPTCPIAAEMSPSLPPGRAAAIPAASAVSVALISSASAVEGGPIGERDRRVADPAVQRRPGVHAEQVALLQPVGAGDAVQRRVVHRRADDGRVRDRGELRVVVEERRGRARPGEHVPGRLVEFLEGDPGRGGARLAASTWATTRPAARIASISPVVLISTIYQTIQARTVARASDATLTRLG